MAKRGVKVVTNPVSNLKLANGVAPVPKMLKAGITVALGTDGSASNNSLNMIRDLSVLTLIHKGVNQDALAITAAEGFTIATKNGALAMGRTDIGEIKPGYIADLAILNLDCPNMQPVNNPLASLAYSAHGSEVETVMVGGKILMENREFTTIDYEKVIYETSKICERIGTTQ
jgi:5-methylthioadenosine/S-adenosylhomocysteine deaminase